MWLKMDTGPDGSKVHVYDFKPSRLFTKEDDDKEEKAPAAKKLNSSFKTGEDGSS